MPATSFFVRMPLMIGIAFSAMVVACGAVAGPHRQGRPPKRIRQDVGRLEPPQRCRFASRAGLLYCLFKTALAAAPSFRPGALTNDAIRADRFLDVQPPLFGQSILGVGWTSRSRAQAPPRSPNRACSARPASYRPAVAVLDRSSVRTWLNSVLSLCAPHWGQRSADDQAPHRGHALCLRFGTTALPVHRCRISLPRTPQQSAPPPKNPIRAWRTEYGACRGRRNIIDQFHSNWKPRGYSPPPSFGSRVPEAAAGRHLPPVRETPRHGLNIQIRAVRIHRARSRDDHELRRRPAPCASWLPPWLGCCAPPGCRFSRPRSILQHTGAGASPGNTRNKLLQPPPKTLETPHRPVAAVAAPCRKSRVVLVAGHPGGPCLPG